jgi:hypothetical protein
MQLERVVNLSAGSLLLLRVLNAALLAQLGDRYTPRHTRPRHAESGVPLTCIVNRAMFQWRSGL